MTAVNDVECPGYPIGAGAKPYDLVLTCQNPARLLSRLLLPKRTYMAGGFRLPGKEIPVSVNQQGNLNDDEGQDRDNENDRS